MTQIMKVQNNRFQASIEKAINRSPIMGKSSRQNPMTYKAINHGSILEQSNKFKSYCGKAIDLHYCSLPNHRLELTAALRGIMRPRSSA
jgi:hypothetical protein